MDNTSVTLGEVFRGLEKLGDKVDGLADQFARYPKWPDFDRAMIPIKERLDNIESAQKTARARTATAVVGGIGSLVVTLLVWLLTGR